MALMVMLQRKWPLVKVLWRTGPRISSPSPCEYSCSVCGVYVHSRHVTVVPHYKRGEVTQVYYCKGHQPKYDRATWEYAEWKYERWQRINEDGTPYVAPVVVSSAVLIAAQIAEAKRKGKPKKRKARN